jgi:hypothetical protein
MGLLDDAIREHLELKRRHGADASEVARQEREALGPVRREPFEPADRESAHADVEDHPAASSHPSDPSEGEYEEYYEEEYYDEEGGDDWGQSFEGEFERPSTRRRRSEDSAPSPEHHAAEPTEEPEPEHRHRRWRLHRRDSEQAPPAQAEPPEHQARGDETVEYKTEDALAAEGRRREEQHPAEAPTDEGDVLEETPEFLQDAPEHDRLWFEQRPPRDFDFDD